MTASLGQTVLVENKVLDAAALQDGDLCEVVDEHMGVLANRVVRGK